MRDIKITIPAGETSYQSVSMRAWHVRSIETDDVVKLVTQEQGALLLHTGQQVELDDSVQGFELINQSAVPVALHLQVAGKASIGSKKNGSEGGAVVDQTARDSAQNAIQLASEKIGSVVEDNSPQLGGELDTNGSDVVLTNGNSISAIANNAAKIALHLLTGSIERLGAQTGNITQTIVGAVAPILRIRTAGIDAITVDAAQMVKIGSGPAAAKLDVSGGVVVSDQLKINKPGGEVLTVGSSSYENKYLQLRDGGFYACRWGLQSNANISAQGVCLMASSKPIAFKAGLEASVEFSDVSGPHLYISPDGKIGVGTSEPGEKMEVNGKIKAISINLSGIPTAATGLNAGDVWNDGGTLKIA